MYSFYVAHITRFLSTCVGIQGINVHFRLGKQCLIFLWACKIQLVCDRKGNEVWVACKWYLLGGEGEIILLAIEFNFT